MSRIEVITLEDPNRWRQLVATSTAYDFYHLPGYHNLAEANGEGSARMFVCSDGSHFAALPLLLRPIDHGILACGSAQLYDATSVYGYCGPVSNHQASRPLSSGFAVTMQAALTATLRELNVISVFSRLHPLLDQSLLLSDIGEVAEVGPTVSIDLTQPPEHHLRQYRKGHRSDLSRLRREGVMCSRDASLGKLDEFAAIYSETMARLGASGDYLYTPSYFRRMAERLGSVFNLFYCTYEGAIACAGIFTLCNGIIQYHLSGAREWAGRLAPTKLMIDTVREWGVEQGAHTFHLGGGLGAREDTLFAFKAGFSPRRHTFRVWKWVVMPDEYEALCQARESRAQQHDIEIAPNTYFPKYRAPIKAERCE